MSGNTMDLGDRVWFREREERRVAAGGSIAHTVDDNDVAPLRIPQAPTPLSEILANTRLCYKQII